MCERSHGKVATPPRFSQNLGFMKQIFINIEDSAYECVLGVLNLCDKVEVVRTEELQGDFNDVDDSFVKAIKELQEEKVIRNKFDYAFIYMAIREGIISGMEPFHSIRGFVEYLKEIGIANPPGKNAISGICKGTTGFYPDWMYDELVDAYEERRRRIVVTRFSSAFTRFMREAG